VARPAALGDDDLARMLALGVAIAMDKYGRSTHLFTTDRRVGAVLRLFRPASVGRLREPDAAIARRRAARPEADETRSRGR
jgi:hypothetical protein